MAIESSSVEGGDMAHRCPSEHSEGDGEEAGRRGEGERGESGERRGAGESGAEGEKLQ